MSRIGKKTINIPQGVQIAIKGNQINVSGKKGQLSLTHNERVRLEHKDNELHVQVVGNERLASPFQGLYNRLINNMIHGVQFGYSKELGIEGVGFRAKMEGDMLSMSLGFSHPCNFKAPKGITITTPTQTQVIIEGIDKQLVGQCAAEIRQMRRTDPYKQKGLRYKGERLRKKVGKAKAK